MLAFHGDPAVKADLLARLRRHAEAGTLLFGATRWDGTRGSPLGVSAESEDVADYVVRFGYPLALAGLLDTVTALVDRERALAMTLAWVDDVAPGADLSSVPVTVLRDMLRRLGADTFAAADRAAVLDLHGREADGTPVARAEWSRLRTGIEAAAEAADGLERDALTACAASCWSLRTSRSVLAELVNMWRMGAASPPDPDFSARDHAEAETLLHALWTETRPHRDAGEVVEIPTLFRSRAPDIAARFEANLARANAISARRNAEAPELVLTALRAAGRRVADRHDAPCN